MAFVVGMYVGVHLLNKARSDRTMARLREVQAPKTRVLREGQMGEIPVGEVVVGDVLPLQAGTRVAADGRLFSSVGLLVNEAALTGESAPVRKDAEASRDAVGRAHDGCLCRDDRRGRAGESAGRRSWEGQ